MIKTKQDFINEVAERLNNRNIHAVVHGEAIVIDDSLNVEDLLEMEGVLQDVHALVPLTFVSPFDKIKPTYSNNRGKHFVFQFDREFYAAPKQFLTGTEIRQALDISSAKELWEIIPGGSDRKISDTDAVDTFSGGLRIFSAPKVI